MANTIQCPTCGANAKKLNKTCEYCGNYLVHLFAFERRKEPVGTGTEKIYFRSLKWLYKLSIFGSLAGMVSIYLVFFNQLSETQLVQITPIWFLPFYFGVCGVFSENALHLVLNRKAANFKEALQKVFADTPGLTSLISQMVFLPLYTLLPLKNVSSPFRLAIITTVAWAAILAFFFGSIFPSL